LGDRHLRKRGVAVVLRQGKVLLVKDRGKNKYSLPGGGVHDNERSYQAAARELYEETGLRAKKLTYFGSFNGAVSEHKAFLTEAEGHVHLKQPDELISYLWWDMKSDVPVYAHVKAILAMLTKNNIND
jgi:8-oxo-dGTP diphosphatase